MADEHERKALEDQLELQLKEQKDSLAAIDEALLSQPSDPELLSVQEELVQAIKDAEEGLFHLKRARLLQEADVALHSSEFAGVVKETTSNPKDVEVEPLEEYLVGSKCRFRHSDGRWYDGQIVQMEGSDAAKVSFLTPTSENMLICKFFLQQRCRFGSNCRLSHGFDLPVTSLKKYNPTIWNQSLVGSSIWATSESKPGIWRKAELESWDEKQGLAAVVFQDDGSSSILGTEFISLSAFSQISDEEDSEASSDDSNSTDNEEVVSGGLGFLGSSNLQRGIQTETAIFAKWENHTRGIASKMMANMGYSEGMGLGVTGQGIIDPISVKQLPPRQSLDNALEPNRNKSNEKKKRSRGGKRKRDRKFAEAARAAKQEEESNPDVFSLINSQLAMHGEQVNGGSGKKHNKDNGEGKKEDRQALVAYDHEVKDLKMRVEKLEEMANRNKNEKVVYEAALRKLNETRKALADVEAAHASVSSAVTSKEKEKKWLKF